MPPRPNPSFDLISQLEESTIDGLKQTLGKKTKCCNFLWFVGHALCLSLLSALYISSITRYTSFEIQTTMKVTSQKDALEFPSIVFCTTSMLRSSLLHSKFDFQATYLAVMAKWSAGSNIEETKKWFNRTCKKDVEYPYEFTPSNFKDMDMMLNKVTLTYQDIVILCWFSGKLVPCKEKGVFDHTLTDLGPCFVFNGFPNTTSRVAEDSNTLVKAAGVGREYGAKFLMNIHEEEYCITQNTNRGNGILFGLKENYAGLTFNSEKGFRGLPAGYETGVNIKVTQFIRNTEHLGRCVNKKLVDTNGQNPSPYYYGLCTAKVIVQNLFEICGCIIPSKKSHIPYLNPRNVELTGFPLNYTFDVDCRNIRKYGMCAFVQLQQVYYNQLWRKAPFCPLPCRERTFTLTFDTKKLNSKLLTDVRNSTMSSIVENSYKNVSQQTNISFEKWIDRNLVMANFFYGSSNVYVYIDNQAYSWSDMLIDLANSSGLFYGLSFLTFFEIFYFLMRYIGSKMHDLSVYTIIYSNFFIFKSVVVYISCVILSAILRFIRYRN